MFYTYSNLILFEQELVKFQVRRTRQRFIAGETRTNSQMAFFFGPFRIEEFVLVDQQELTYINSVRTQVVVWKTCLRG